MHGDTYQLNHREMFGSPDSITVAKSSSSASLFSKGCGFMNAFDFTMQLQVGCPAGCLYCYVRTGFRLAPHDVQQNWGFEVRDKVAVGEKLTKALLRNELAGKTLYWSGVSDAYAARPAVTEEVWNRLIQCVPELRPKRIVVQTRFRPSRDVKLMAEYQSSSSPDDGGPAVVVSYSIGTDRQDLVDAWELRTPSYASRVSVIQQLRAAGIWVVPTLSPLGPWRDLPGELQRLRALDIPYITTLFFKEQTGASRTPKPFLDHLQNFYPEVLDPHWLNLRVAEMKAVFGTDRVLVGKAGFDSLAAPQRVG